MNQDTVIDRHLRCFQAGDVEGLLADYSADCVLLIDDQVIEGRDALRAFFEHVFTAMFPGGVAVDIQNRASAQGATIIKWTAETPNLKVLMGADTMVLRDGKIAIQTVALKAEPAGA